MNAQQVKDAIEAFLDYGRGFDSLAEVYQHIGDLCREKADHVRSNWQDESLAHVWERYGKACDAASVCFEREQRKID